MSIESLTILITPQVHAALEAEVERAGPGSGVTGGLLFGHPLDEQRRLVVGWVRLSSEVGFGQKDFSLDQSRTSQPLDQARRLSPEANYCGVWYIHHTPNRELTDEEWIQAQTVLEDPDFRFQDVVCLVMCLYFGKLTFYTSTLDKHQSARGQLPQPASLLKTTAAESLPTDQTGLTRSSYAKPDLQNWYKSPEIAQRLNEEHDRLSQKYHVEASMDRDARMTFRLMPKRGYGKLTFHLVCGPGFPQEGPTAFLWAGETQHSLFSPGLNDWSADQWLVDVADGMAEWLKWSLDEYMAAAQNALSGEAYQEAADWLTVVLSLDPRRPRAARLLAKAQAPLHIKQG
ncbi:MAG TPA: hypothetical protein ENN99_05105 [Chloroflexi bacterium]|nr:hypothetical protein [Chloroflexota bacterium]